MLTLPAASAAQVHVSIHPNWSTGDSSILCLGLQPVCSLYFLTLCYCLQLRLQQEHDRCLHYLDPSTRKALITAVEQQLISRHIAAVLDKGFAALMDGHRVSDLARLYGLTARISAHDALKASWREYVINTGMKIVKPGDEDKVNSRVAVRAAEPSPQDALWHLEMCMRDMFHSLNASKFMCTCMLLAPSCVPLYNLCPF